MSGITLYKIADQFRELQTLAETDELPAEVIADTLDGLQGDLTLKATNIGMLVRNLESTADAIDEAAKAMQLRAKRARARADSIKQYVLLQMQLMEITKIECTEFVISRRTNPPAVKIMDGAVIPDRFKTQKPAPPPEIDKRKLAEELKRGEVIDGVSLEQGERLEIKV